MEQNIHTRIDKLIEKYAHLTQKNQETLEHYLTPEDVKEYLIVCRDVQSILSRAMEKLKTEKRASSPQFYQ